MEAIREYSVEAIRVMHWEGIDFELLEPEITLERPRVSQRKPKPHLTVKQKKLMEAEHFTHTLP